jgi:hypothetical protein
MYVEPTLPCGETDGARIERSAILDDDLTALDEQIFELSVVERHDRQRRLAQDRHVALASILKKRYRCYYPDFRRLRPVFRGKVCLFCEKNNVTTTSFQLVAEFGAKIGNF